jgi:HPt (histidine-containing phosphotransfer) domain-containing protein
MLRRLQRTIARSAHQAGEAIARMDIVSSKPSRVEALRSAFRERLKDDAQRLSELAARLEEGDATDAPTAEQILFLVHRMGGAAYVFGYESLGDAASALEALGRQSLASADAAASNAFRAGCADLIAQLRRMTL